MLKETNTFKKVTDHMVRVSEEMIPRKSGPLSIKDAMEKTPKIMGGKHLKEIKEYFEDNL